MRRAFRPALVSLVLLLSGPRAGAFSLLFDAAPANLQASLEGAARWAATAGLVDIQVGVEAGFAANLGAASPAEVALVNQSVAAAFAAWESPVLDFDVMFDTTGQELDLFAVPGSHPAFTTAPSAFGRTFADLASGSRALTNGQVFDGLIVTGGEIFVNVTNTLQFAALLGLTQQQQLDALQRLLMHEIGHALGLGHPNDNNLEGNLVNLDTDTDPSNAMAIDPLDPFGDLAVSTFPNNEAIMSNRACGGAFCGSLLFTSLTNDDIGGRDVLYPIPEPSTAALVAAGLALVGLTRQRR